MAANIPHEIEIVIDEQGKIQSTVHGVAGPDCAKVSAWLDELGEVLVDEQTADFRLSPKVKATEKQKARS